MSKTEIQSATGATTHKEHGERVAAMFGRIAGWYDFLNHALSGCQDIYWRYRLAKAARPKPGETVLDLAAGTMDVSVELMRQYPECKVAALDFALPMLENGKAKKLKDGREDSIHPVQADGRALPLADNSMGAATIAFGIRNILPREDAYKEFYRVLKPGARLCILEFGTGSKRVWKGLYNFYLDKLLPFIGDRISGDPGAYRYLAETIKTFPDERALAQELVDAGFERVYAVPMMSGIVYLHVCEKPLKPKTVVAPKKVAAPKAEAKKVADEQAPVKKTAAKTSAAPKAEAEKPAPKKAAPKKAVAEETAAKKAVVEKVAPKEAKADKPAAQKAAPKKAAPKKMAPKKAVPEKGADKEVKAEKASAEKPQAEKPAAKKPAAKKPAAKKAVSKEKPVAKAEVKPAPAKEEPAKVETVPAAKAKAEVTPVKEPAETAPAVKTPAEVAPVEKGEIAKAPAKQVPAVKAPEQDAQVQKAAQEKKTARKKAAQMKAKKKAKKKMAKKSKSGRKK